jgi:hypothetical protein
VECLPDQHGANHASKYDQRYDFSVHHRIPARL